MTELDIYIDKGYGQTHWGKGHDKCCHDDDLYHSHDLCHGYGRKRKALLSPLFDLVNEIDHRWENGGGVGNKILWSSRKEIKVCQEDRVETLSLKSSTNLLNITRLKLVD